MLNSYSSKQLLRFTAKSLSESGEYTCRAVDPVTNRESSAARALLTVNIMPGQSYAKITSPAHELTQFDRVVRAKESDDVKFHCAFRNVPELSTNITIKWLKLENQKEYSILNDVTETELSLPHVQNEDAGRYYCVVNYDGVNQLFDYVDLEVDRYDDHHHHHHILLIFYYM